MHRLSRGRCSSGNRGRRLGQAAVLGKGRFIVPAAVPTARGSAVAIPARDRRRPVRIVGRTRPGHRANPSSAQSKPIARSLGPVGLEESRSGIGPCRHEGGDRASDKGFLPLSTAQYLELLDWTARQMREDKRGATPASAAPLFERSGIDVQSWYELTRDCGRLFSSTFSIFQRTNVQEFEEKLQTYEVATNPG